MKRTRCLLANTRRTALAGLLLLGLCFGGAYAQANSKPFNHVFVFGDSLSDTGNYYRLSGGYPQSPYLDGRFCNGPLWVEYLVASLGMEYQPADNFAVGGATTGTLNSNDGFEGKLYPGLLDEIASFQAAGPVNEPERALYIVGAGANDFFIALNAGTPPATLIANGVNNTLHVVQQLSASGARFIMVMNVPDLGVTPMALNLGLGTPLSQLTAAYNQALNLALDQLEKAGIPTIRLNSFAVLDEMANSPAVYGFSDVTTPFVLSTAGGNPDDFLFWDPVHPTTGAHEVLAKAAVNQLVSRFSPSNGAANPATKINGLHGLVNANLVRP